MSFKEKFLILIMMIIIVKGFHETHPTIGVCYYPEQWPSYLWEKDIKQMSELGLKYIRIGIHFFKKKENSCGLK
jgi:beta-galactosidase